VVAMGLAVVVLDSMMMMRKKNMYSSPVSLSL